MPHNIIYAQSVYTGTASLLCSSDGSARVNNIVSLRQSESVRRQVRSGTGARLLAKRMRKECEKKWKNTRVSAEKTAKNSRKLHTRRRIINNKGEEFFSSKTPRAPAEDADAPFRRRTSLNAGNNASHFIIVVVVVHIVFVGYRGGGGLSPRNRV